MLVLSRKLGEEVVIDQNIRVTVVAIHGNRVRLGITAPVSIPVRRGEVGPHDNPQGEPRPGGLGQAAALS